MGGLRVLKRLMEENEMQPLEGFRVLDLTHVLAGPCATHHLCCLGAEVIKVERPGGGDPMRALDMQPEHGGLPPGFRALNAGKKSIAIDLVSQEGKAFILDLVKDCDILVENFRPGTAARLGLGPDEIHAIRPDIIYCSISGWGQGGAFGERGAYDHVIQAATGMMALQGGENGGAPVKVGFPVIDIATGISAAEAILSAVVRRLRGDTARITLDVSMVDSALALMAGQVATTMVTGQAPARVGNRGFVGSPGAETFKTADGYISVAANTFGQFSILCALLGRDDLAKPPFVPAGLSNGAFLANAATEELRAELAKAFAAATAVAMEEKLNAAGVPAARVRDLAQYLVEVYPQTRGIGVQGEALALGPAFRCNGVPAPSIGPAVTLGADNAAFMGERTGSAWARARAPAQSI